LSRRLSDDDFHQAMAEGKIHPGTTRKEAAALGKSSQNKIHAPIAASQ
jgi:hypothetical protein